MVWSATNPEKGIRSLLERQISNYSELEKSLIDDLTKIRTITEKKIQEEVAVFSGFERVFSEIADRLNNASSSICIFSVGEKVPTQVEIASARAIKRGVKLRFIASTYIEDNKDILKKWQKDDWMIRYLPGSREYTFAVFDKKECVIVVKNPKVQDERMLVGFANPDLSNALQEYFELIWKKARPV